MAIATQCPQCFRKGGRLLAWPIVGEQARIQHFSVSVQMILLVLTTAISPTEAVTFLFALFEYHPQSLTAEKPFMVCLTYSSRCFLVVFCTPCFCNRCPSLLISHGVITSLWSVKKATTESCTGHTLNAKGAALPVGLQRAGDNGSVFGCTKELQV